MINFGKSGGSGSDGGGSGSGWKIGAFTSLNTLRFLTKNSIETQKRGGSTTANCGVVVHESLASFTTTTLILFGYTTNGTFAAILNYDGRLR